jgi:hypothetical protein
MRIKYLQPKKKFFCALENICLLHEPNHLYIYKTYKTDTRPIKNLLTIYVNTTEGKIRPLVNLHKDMPLADV